MKKLFAAWWQDLIRITSRIYLPIATTVLFSLIAVTYWENYAHISTIIFLILAFVVSDFIFKKRGK
ncbi:MAG: hypothetical protein WCD24_18705 [Serratia inhibens]|uniref:hypothetical protein n=1 Tax=Serratia inhibens TaxID=2338073 RepID=UPI003C7BC5AD